MAKIRVHELAKELDKSNKEVMDVLIKNGVDVKSHMSNIEEDDAAKARSVFGKKAEPAKTAAPAASQSAESAEVPAADAEKPKKKNIIRVFRSQNASGKLPERRPRREDGRRPERPDGRRPERPDGKRPAVPAKPEVKPETVKPVAEAPKQEAPKQEAPKQEVPKAEAPKQEVPKQEAPKAEAPAAKPEQAKQEVQKTMTTQTETRKGMEREKTTQNRDGQNRGYNRDRDNNRDGQNRGYNRDNNRDGQNRGYNRDRDNNRDGQNRGFNRDNNRDGQNRDGQNRGYNRDNNRDGQNRAFNRDRDNNRDGQNRGFNRDGGRDGQNRGFNRENQNRDNQNRNFNRDNRDRRNDFDKDKDGNEGRPQSRSFQRPQRPAMEVPDAPLVKKTSRDPRKDNKEREKNREQLKENNGKRPNQSNRPNQKKDQFKRVPKALEKPVPKQKQEVKQEVVTEITIPEKLTIRELADAMKMQPSVIIKKLFMEGIIVTMNNEIDFEKAAEIAMDFDIIAEQEEKVDVIEELLKEEEESEDLMTSRPPVVCVMGHVDHGKTSLLDAIRHTHVTSREAGGITQHIGAYTVDIDGQQITFLDTPGHEAFSSIRIRGAKSTDIAILVVAADDGVMPQTIEAINHAKAAGVEIIVAINKIDKPSANIDRVKQELTEYGLIAEDWGGSTVFAPVSAHTKEGIDNLLEMILLTAEVMELKANPDRKARGLVIEAQLDKGKGPVATILVQKGTLHVGDFIACGACSGKVRAMMDDKGQRVKEAGPSTPVEILGLSDVPNAGEVLVATNSDKEAKEFAATFISENRNKMLEDTKQRMSLDDLFNQIQEGNLKELPLIVKADVQGSVEAVKQSLLKLSNEEVVVKVIHSGVGAVNESDVTLASASNAIIVGFNVRPDATAKATAEQEGVDVRLYSVIYQAIEEIEAAMKGMLDAIYEPKTIGHAIVRQVFKASGVGNIAGSYVTDGEFQRNCLIHISREGEQIYEGKLASLKRFKDDVKEVKAGYECGLVFEDFNDVKEDDIIEAYIMVEVPR